MYFKASTKYRKTDRLFRQIILSERENKCVWCKCVKPVDVAHILDKGRYRKMRYVKANVMLLCRSCHQRWHDNPLDASKFISQFLGDDYCDELRRMNEIISHIPDLKLCVLVFKKELEALKGI